MYNATIFRDVASHTEAKQRCNEINATLPWSKFSIVDVTKILKYEHFGFWLSFDAENINNDTFLPGNFLKQVLADMNRPYPVSLINSGCVISVTEPTNHRHNSQVYTCDLTVQ